MSVPFYEFRMQDNPRVWDLQILHDAHGNARGDKNRWAELRRRPKRSDLIPPLELAVERAGKIRDITFVHCEIPVLSPHVADVLRKLAGERIELIPAKVQDVPGDYFVMNVLSEVKCLDEAKTRYVQKWTEYYWQPHRVGEYAMIEGLVINPELAARHNLFRLWGHNSRLIVSASIKEAFEREGFTGVDFIDVCSPQPTLAEMAAQRKKMREFYDHLLAPAIEECNTPQKLGALLR